MGAVTHYDIDDDLTGVQEAGLEAIRQRTEEIGRREMIWRDGTLEIAGAVI